MSEKLSWLGSAGVVLFVVVAGFQIVRGSLADSAPPRPEAVKALAEQFLSTRTEPPVGGLAQPASTPASVSMPLLSQERVIARLFKDGWGNLVALPACSACKRETASDARRCGSCQVTLVPAEPGSLKCPNCHGRGGWFPCSRCGGRGKRMVNNISFPCAWCKGDGTEDCQACNRRGIIN